MSRSASLGTQRGATLVVGLIMLLLITLMVSSAFMLSTTNLKSVGNMQFKEESIAAANVAIEQVLSSPFTTDPNALDNTTINADINNDGTTDYVVGFNVENGMHPLTCIRAVQAPTTSSETKCDVEHPCDVPLYFNTVWDINATVTDAANGASVRVRQGVRVLLTQTQCNAVCPPAPSTACS